MTSAQPRPRRRRHRVRLALTSPDGDRARRPQPGRVRDREHPRLLQRAAGSARRACRAARRSARPPGGTGSASPEPEPRRPSSACVGLGVDRVHVLDGGITAYAVGGERVVAAELAGRRNGRSASSPEPSCSPGWSRGLTNAHGATARRRRRSGTHAVRRHRPAPWAHACPRCPTTTGRATVPRSGSRPASPSGGRRDGGLRPGGRAVIAAITSRNNCGSLLIRTVSRRSPVLVIRTSTDRRRCRSIPTICRPSYAPLTRGLLESMV